MTPLSRSLRAGAWLARDAAHQAISSRLWWFAVAVGLIAIGLCASVSIEGGDSLRPPGEDELVGRDGEPLTGPNPHPGQLVLGFGAVRVPLFRDGDAMGRHLQAMLAWTASGAAVAMLALLGTAGLVPESLRPQSIAVELARPTPRWLLLIGRSAGVLGLVALYAIAVIGGCWAALGARTGAWEPRFLFAVPLMLLQFAPLFAVSVWLAVKTRSASASLLGAMAFWLLCAAVNLARCSAVTWHEISGDASPLPAAASWVIESAYWCLPKPLDLLAYLQRGVPDTAGFPIPEACSLASSRGLAAGIASLATTALFPFAAFWAAARRFGAIDY